jgi:hypothetical protein
MVLRKVVSDPAASRELKRICDEALDIDLISPQDREWKREVVVPISGVNTRISLSLVPLSLTTRAIMKTISTDVPERDRGNRFGYRLTLEPETSRGGAMLNRAYGMLRQSISLCSLSAPMMVTCYLMTRFPFGELVPRMSENGTIQGALADGVAFTTLAAVGALTYQAYRGLTRRMLLSDDPGMGRKDAPR